MAGMFVRMIVNDTRSCGTETMKSQMHKTVTHKKNQYNISSTGISNFVFFPGLTVSDCLCSYGKVVTMVDLICGTALVVRLLLLPFL